MGSCLRKQPCLQRSAWHNVVMPLPHGCTLCVLQLAYLWCSAAELSRCTCSRPLWLNQWAPAGGDGVQLPLGRCTAGQAAHQTLPTLLGQVCAAWFRPSSVQPPVLQGAPLGSARCLQHRLACSNTPMRSEARHAWPVSQRTSVTGEGCMHWAAVSCSVHTGLAADSAWDLVCSPACITLLLHRPSHIT